jgi:hypothetical protein
MRTHVALDFVLIAFAALVCLGSLKLGFGSFSDPGTGFMPFLAGALLGVLSMLDLVSAVFGNLAAAKTDEEIWSNIHWSRLLSALVSLVIYTALLPLLGFSLPTALLLFFLLRLIEPRPRWLVILSAVGITSAFYVVFAVALGARLPRGILGF